MTDHELLRLAAKAVCVDVYESTDGTVQNRPVWVYSAGGGMGTMPYEEQWNPLVHDATAFQLAVRLRISIEMSASGRIVAYYLPEKEEDIRCVIELESRCRNRPEVTRRAIVMAAAEIGRH